jgi:TetR/AcrR family transcriptional regulator, ethionamide resistance regulator
MPAVTRRKVSRAERREFIANRLFLIVEGMLAKGYSFSEISVEQLITEAEIARSTFYVYFEDKGALMVELMDRVTQAIGEAAEEWLHFPATGTREDLHVALTRLADSYREHGRMLSAVIETAAYEPRVRDQYADVMARRSRDMTDAFVPQQRQGSVRADIDVFAVTPWLAWMFERGLYQMVGHGGEVDDAAIAGVTSVVWQTLYEGTR